MDFADDVTCNETGKLKIDISETDHGVDILSGGERQRMATACAIYFKR